MSRPAGEAAPDGAPLPPERGAAAPPPLKRATARGLAFRPVSDGDLAFLQALYASTRQAELALVPWSAAERGDFLRGQFEAQHRHYRAHCPAAWFLVIERDGAPIGRLYLDERADEFRIVDVALLPAHRGRGLGAAVLRDVLDAAAARGKAVRIHVETGNRARRLYARLGFCVVENRGVYDLLEWRAAPASAAPVS